MGIVSWLIPGNGYACYNMKSIHGTASDYALAVGSKLWNSKAVLEQTGMVECR